MRPAHSILAALVALSPVALPARADLITVLATDTLIVNHNDIFIAGFLPRITTKPTDEILHNSIRFSFLPSGADVVALVSGNDLAPYPPAPFPTLSFCVDGDS